MMYKYLCLTFFLIFSIKTMRPVNTVRLVFADFSRNFSKGIEYPTQSACVWGSAPNSSFLPLRYSWENTTSVVGSLSPVWNTQIIFQLLAADWHSLRCWEDLCGKLPTKGKFSVLPFVNIWGVNPWTKNLFVAPSLGDSFK